MRYTTTSALAIATLLLTATFDVWAGDAAVKSGVTGFVPFATQAEGEEQPAVVYVPEDYDPELPVERRDDE